MNYLGKITNSEKLGNIFAKCFIFYMSKQQKIFFISKDKLKHTNELKEISLRLASFFWKKNKTEIRTL